MNTNNNYYYVGMNDGLNVGDYYFILEIDKNADLQETLKEITKIYAEYKTKWYFNPDRLFYNFFGEFDSLEDWEIDELKEEYQKTCNIDEFYQVDKEDFPENEIVNLQDILNNNISW